MLRRIAFAALTGITQACSFGQEAPSPDVFRLCSDNPAHKSVISMDYSKLVGLSDDYGRPISRCGQAEAACIDFPLVLSVPPRLPRNAAEVVRWSAGDDQFSIRLLPGASDAYLLEAVDYRQDLSGSLKRQGSGFYTYSSDVGIMTLRVAGEAPHGWVRCGGRLTFEDLRALVRRLP